MAKRLYVALVLVILGLFALYQPSQKVKAQTSRAYIAPTRQGAGNCTSWANACIVDDVPSNGGGYTEIWIKAGRYVTTKYWTINVYGGFAGTETELNQRNIKQNLTIFSGDTGNDDIVDERGIVLDYNNIQGTNLVSGWQNVGGSLPLIYDGFVVTGFTGSAVFKYNPSVNSGFDIFFRNMTISGNNAVAIYAYSADYSNRTTIENSIIQGNKQGYGTYDDDVDDTVVVKNSLFYGNHTTDNVAGGFDGGTTTNISIENSTFSNNTGYKAGGVHVESKKYAQNPQLYNNTIVNNSGTSYGGLYVSKAVSGGGTVILENNIVANNTPSDCYLMVNGDVYHNLVKISCSTLFDGNGNITGADPQLGALQDNGGFIKTISPLVGSPVIDAGMSTGISPDARGVSRPQDGNGDSIAVYDMGAVEFVLDSSPPLVSSIVRNGSNPTNASQVVFTVNFTESVIGVDTSDFQLTTSGVSGASIVSVSGSGAIYSVAVNTGSGNGTIRLDVKGTATIQDTAGNPISGVPYTSGQSYTIDKTAPQVTGITRLGTSPTNASQVQFGVVFSEAVTGVDGSDFSLTVSGITGASVASVSGSGSSYTVTVNTGSGDGTIRLDIPSSATIDDLAGNGINNKPYTGDESYTIDKTRPQVVSITRLDPLRSRSQTVRYQIIFSEPVIGLTLADFEVLVTGTLSGVQIVSLTGSGDTWIVTIDTGTGSGTIRLKVK
ncbi:MAG: Polymorphic membrane protein, Chlamydia [Anaerolineae bacterium]|nr:MAG: Polymorphic membrane protein, Chlamydia [Anaerolineae bacterium]